MFTSEFVSIEIPALVLVIAVGIITYYKWAFTYWKKRHLHTFEKPTIPFGNIQMIVPPTTVNWGVFFKIVYDKIKAQGLKHAGGFLFFKPFYVATDPGIIKEVMQRRFDHFHGRGVYTNEKDDPLSINLAFAEGEKWRYLHRKISPAFRTAKMKAMFEILVSCGYELQKAVECKYENKETIDFSDVSTCYTLEIIGAYAYDTELNSFNDLHSKFRKYAKKAIHTMSSTQLPRLLFGMTFPKLARQLGVTLFTKDTNKFFIDIIKDSVRFRKANNIVRSDLLQLLIEYETHLDVEEIDKKTIESTSAINEIAAQVFIFLAGGFETSSLALAYCLYELSMASNIQNKLKDEINKVLIKYEGEVTYDAIMEMKYMNQVVQETLRKYPSLPFIARKCMKDCEIFDTKVVVRKGMYVAIPVLGIHYDPDYYPEPEKFDPDRFSDENKEKRLPYTYLAFGEGPRLCPAYRFGLLQIKVGLTVLLQRYKFSLNARTPVPIEISTTSATLAPKTPIFLDIEKRNKDI